MLQFSSKLLDDFYLLGHLKEMKASTDEGLQKENWFYVEFYRKVEEPDIFWLTSLSLYIKKQNQKTEISDFYF